MKSLPCANCGKDVRTGASFIEVFTYDFRKYPVIGFLTTQIRHYWNRGTAFCNDECYARWAIRKISEAGIGVEVAVS